METLVADIRESGTRALERAAEDSTANTGCPVAVEGAVTHGSNLVAIENDFVTLSVVGAELEG